MARHDLSATEFAAFLQARATHKGFFNARIHSDPGHSTQTGVEAFRQLAVGCEDCGRPVSGFALLTQILLDRFAGYAIRHCDECLRKGKE